MRLHAKVLNSRKLLNFINYLKAADLMTLLTRFHTVFVQCAAKYALCQEAVNEIQYLLRVSTHGWQIIGIDRPEYRLAYSVTNIPHILNGFQSLQSL